MNILRIAVVAFLVLAVSNVTATAASADDCTGEDVKSFDFLVGEWQEKVGTGRMSITKILEGCGVQEIWRLEGFNAVLLRSYNSTSKTWYLAFTAHDLVPQVWEGKLEN